MARNDIRISVEFPNHPKTKKLRRRLGGDAPFCLVELWCHAANCKRDGALTGMSNEDIAIAAGWEKDPDEFVTTLVEVRFLDDEDGVLIIHDWPEHQPWVAHAEVRAEKAREAANIRHHGNASGKRPSTQSDASRMQTACDPHTDRNAPSPTPSPTPSPEPIPKQEQHGAPAAAASDLENLEGFWAAKKGRVPPLGPGEIASMREALELPGASLVLVQEIVGRRFDQAKSKPATFAYFLPAVRDELQRRNLMAAPIASAPSTPPRAAPPKPRIQDRAHYEILLATGQLDDSWENPHEFSPKGEEAS